VTVNTLAPDAAPVLLARHPILDAAGRVVCHELRFGDGGVPCERATAAAVVLGGGGHDLGGLTCGLPAWIAVSREVLLAFDPLPLAPGSVVLALAAGADADEALLDRLVRLRAEGHALALDDFLPGARADALLAFAGYVKVDLAAYGISGLRTVIDRLPRGRVHLVAGNVETPDQRDACVARGVDLLQGFFFERPRPVAGTPALVASVGRLRALLALRGRPTLAAIERVVAADPGLAVRVLRVADAAAAGSRRPLSSVREALVLLGARRVRRIVLLVLLAELGEGRPALVAAGALRGRLCETLAIDLGLPDPDAAFTVGVLSIADALLDQPLTRVIDLLPVTDELRFALLVRSGPLGALIDVAVRQERDRAGAVGAGHFADAVAWADAALAAL
jgi:EAL and modified HD-GYP domain-containing signal transduction protein